MWIGIVDLRDLAKRYAWFGREIAAFLSIADLEPSGDGTQRFAPPPVLVAICPEDEPEHIERHAAWLSLAEKVLVVRERSAATVEEAELFEEVWSSLPERADPRMSWAYWDPSAPSTAGQVLAAARRLARDVAPAAPEPVQDAEFVPELPPGPWIELSGIDDFDEWAALLARRVTLRGGRVVLWTGHGTQAVDLQDPQSDLPPFEDSYRVACSGRGERVRCKAWSDWLEETADPSPRRFHAPGWIPGGFDPLHPIGWTGSRMFFDWLIRGRDGLGWLSATDHDFPCGPAKKQYGYLDNEPQQISLSPTADAFLATFNRDALLSSAVPIRWRAADDLHVADFPRDPNRAVFHVQADEISRNFDPLEEDGHGGAPVMVLGPSPSVRYAVSLEHEVHRIHATEPGEGEAVRVGGPGEGYAVCDASHRVVRLCRGRLLGGWWRWATVEDRGHYHRVDLESGASVPLEPAEISGVVAVPIPGTRNVALIDRSGDEKVRLRVL